MNRREKTIISADDLKPGMTFVCPTSSCTIISITTWRRADRSDAILVTWLVTCRGECTIQTVDYDYEPSERGMVSVETTVIDFDSSIITGRNTRAEERDAGSNVQRC